MIFTLKGASILNCMDSTRCWKHSIQVLVLTRLPHKIPSDFSCALSHCQSTILPAQKCVLLDLDLVIGKTTEKQWTHCHDHEISMRWLALWHDAFIMLEVDIDCSHKWMGCGIQVMISMNRPKVCQGNIPYTSTPPSPAWIYSCYWYQILNLTSVFLSRKILEIFLEISPVFNCPVLISLCPLHYGSCCCSPSTSTFCSVQLYRMVIWVTIATLSAQTNSQKSHLAD